MLDRTRLVLSRRVGQQFSVGDTTITVVRIGNGLVRILVEAPRETPVSRPDAKKKGPKKPS